MSPRILLIGVALLTSACSTTSKLHVPPSTPLSLPAAPASLDTSPPLLPEPSATLQEILSQPEAWSKTLTALEQSATVETFLRDSSAKTEWLFLGCGTSYYLAEAAAASWTMLTGQRAHALPASEPLLFPDLALKHSAGLQSVIISRSGSTSEAVRVANLFSREFRIPTLGITCTADSPLERACDATIRLSTANEKSTVMTCSFTSMLLTLQHLADRKSPEKNLTVALAYDNFPTS